MEMLLSIKPEMVVVSNDVTSLSVKVNDSMKKMRTPVLEMTLGGSPITPKPLCA